MGAFTKKHTHLVGGLFLFIAAFIWGCAFMSQKIVADNSFEAIPFCAVRFFIGGLTLLPVVLITSVYRKKIGYETHYSKKHTFLGGAVCGTVLFISAVLQQTAIKYTTPGKCGFITALYIVLVPFASWLIFGRKPSAIVWLSVVAAVVGLYLLCITGSDAGSVNKGDLLTLCCAVTFTAHILVVEYFCPKVDGVLLSCIQFFTCSALSFIAVLLWGYKISFEIILQNIGPLLYMGCLSCGIAYTFQVLGQKRTPPAIASIIMSLESVFSVLISVVYGYTMSAREIAGCAIMFIAVIAAQIQFPKRKKTDVA